MKRRQAWTLPLLFLLGYLAAWGTILVDRQMVIAEQRELRRELADAKKRLRLRELVDNFGSDWQEMVIWNEEKKTDPPKEGK